MGWHWQLVLALPNLESHVTPLTFTPTKLIFSATGNRTPVSRVTGGDTSHYTIAELMKKARPGKFIIRYFMLY
jgi:hypothetical protein